MSRAVDIGELGEAKFAQLLENKSRYLNFFYVNDLCLPRGGKIPTQIDFLVFSCKGFYCIELKNWKGTLTVDDSAKYLFVRYTDQPLKVSNPMLQNGIHVRTLYEETNYTFKNRVILTGNKLGTSECIKTIDEFFTELTTGPDIYEEEFVKKTYEVFKGIKEENFLDSYSRGLFIDYQIEDKHNKAMLKRRGR